VNVDGAAAAVLAADAKKINEALTSCDKTALAAVVAVPLSYSAVDYKTEHFKDLKAVTAACHRFDALASLGAADADVTVTAATSAVGMSAAASTGSDTRRSS
jgi:hypothetical protein